MSYVLSGTTVSISATRTAQAAVRFGWLTLVALAEKQTLHSAVMQAGDRTIVVTLGTSRYRVLLTRRVNMQVRNNSLSLLLFA